MTRDEIHKRIQQYAADRADRYVGATVGRWQTDCDRAADAMWLRLSGWTYAQIAAHMGIASTGAHNIVTRWSRRLGIPRPDGTRTANGPEPPTRDDPAPKPKPLVEPSIVSLARTLARIEVHGGQLYGRPAMVCRMLGTKDVPRMRHVLTYLRERHAVAFAEFHGSDGDPRWQVTARVRL